LIYIHGFREWLCVGGAQTVGINGIKGLCFWTLGMLDHRRLFEAPSTRLGTAPEIDVDIPSNSKVVGVFLFVLVNFVLFVFACIALTHSDNDLIFHACDGTLRIIVMVDLIAPLAGLFVWGCSCLIPRCDNIGKDARIGLYAFLFIVTAGLCIFTFMASDQALKKPDCVSAMRSTDDISAFPGDHGYIKGLKSPSANTGWPLLAVSGYYYGLFYACLAIMFLIFCVLECRKS